MWDCEAEPTRKNPTPSQPSQIRAAIPVETARNLKNLEADLSNEG
jgi:hypothetical protein